MCGRTALTASAEDLRATFGLDDAPAVTPHYNVPPSQPVAAVRVLRGSPKRSLELLRWGLVPSWADDVKMGHRLSLARVETLTTSPAFRDALRHRRCLVVVSGFYEWERGGKGPSHPYFVRSRDGALMALAGLWERWTSRDGEVVESCAIVTQPARPPVDAVHDRMPLVLERAEWDAWLDPAAEPAEALLAPHAPGLDAYAVSAHVNDPRHDDARCLQPEAPAQGALF